MAAAPKKGGARLYGKSPRIDADPADGDTIDTGGGAPAAAADAAGATAGAPAAEGTMNTDQGPEGDVMAGTEGIPTHHHEASRERAEMHHRQRTEHDEMHHRHEREHLMRVMGAHHEDRETMHERHHTERKALHSRHEKEMREMHARHEESPERGGKAGPSGGIK